MMRLSLKSPSPIQRDRIGKMKYCIIGVEVSACHGGCTYYPDILEGNAADSM